MDRPLDRGHLPRRRPGITIDVTIDGERFRITMNAAGDGSLGEVLIQWGKQGTAGLGLVDSYATALSLGLQDRVPLIELIRQGLGLRFDPHGATDDPEIPEARSIVDYIARRLAIDWLSADDRKQLGVHAPGATPRTDSASEPTA